MSTLSKRFGGDFYDADYYERGKESGKGWLTNYHWMPRRSFREAFAYIDGMGMGDDSFALDVGCAKGFLVRALRLLDIRADGCDISDYALSFAPYGCWNCSDPASWAEHADRGYTHVTAKDVFEHMTPDQLGEVLSLIAKVAPRMMCVVPMGDSGKYRIPEYHCEVSHLIAEDEGWWHGAFLKAGWSVTHEAYHMPGLKDNWRGHADGKGNRVFVLSRA